MIKSTFTEEPLSTAENESPSTELSAPPARLESLTLGLTDHTFPIQKIIKATLSSPTPVLKSLSITHGIEHLHSLYPLSSTLTSFKRQKYPLSESSITLLTTFLGSAIYLSHLSLGIANAEQLTPIFDCLKVSLRSFEVIIREGVSNVEENRVKTLRVLREAAKSFTLSSLVRIKIAFVGSPHKTSYPLCVKGCGEFVAAFERNRTKINGWRGTTTRSVHN